MGEEQGNLFRDVAAAARDEEFRNLLSLPNVKIERIVSTGQSSPLGFWYDQAWTEWVVVLAGRAAVQFEGEAEPRRLDPGSYLLIPAGRRHRVAWTSPDEPTIWLAIHAGDLSN